ncbi:riboflavin synthase [Salinibacter ruber]|uniref:riboflavin synthase n=1 Tax=Salinibacter ruber TaxID=146919 RepID=UPI00216850A3|nr:riboflavin synthase [Salinibacter ruber]MCS4046225.1 riboflavin synthase [Salinibacter ruber]
MFTGIIEEVGTLTAVESLGSDRAGKRLTIEADLAPELHVDQSVSIDGACQTVVDVDPDASTFAVDSIEETLRKTTFSDLEAGAPVNLERALQAGDRLDGHFVQGHVDATGTITNVEREETDWLYTIQFDPQHAAYLIPVGSVSVDGISLTVARLDEDAFTVAIIPHTHAVTNVAETWMEGAAVNLEFDLIGKYVARSFTASGETPDPEALAKTWMAD